MQYVGKVDLLYAPKILPSGKVNPLYACSESTFTVTVLIVREWFKILMILIESHANQVGVALSPWVMYIFVSNIPSHL